MAATDARPVPRKNVAYRYYFAVRKPSDGTLITTWAGADSEVSLDGASFSDCTNEATEIGTTGCGYIDLTSSEMNADCVLLKITVTNTGAVPLVFTLFPEEIGDYRANVEQFGGTAGTFSSGRPEVNATHWGGTAVASANVLIDGAITAAKIATGAIDADALASDAVTEIQSGLATAANLATVAGYLDTEIAAILADTNELQTDWADGGRLDLLLNSLATSAKLRKYVQLLARKDAAIATDNATELAEINANEGSGAGGYSSQTDSQEALRDRGDAAWVTGSGGGGGATASEIAAQLADQPIRITSPTTTDGTLDLMQGVDYYTADGRDIEFSFYRDYVPDSCKLTIASGNVVTVTSTDITESSGSGSGRFSVRFQLARADGDDLEAGYGTFEVISVVGAREVGEIAEGVATIRRRLTT